MQKRLVLVCEGSLCPRKLSDVSGPGLGEAGHYNINDDEKKQEAFLGGFNHEIRTLVEVSTHSDFNAMINRAITIERNRKSELSERK